MRGAKIKYTRTQCDGQKRRKRQGDKAKSGRSMAYLTRWQKPRVGDKGGKVVNVLELSYRSTWQRQHTVLTLDHGAAPGSAETVPSKILRSTACQAHPEDAVLESEQIEECRHLNALSPPMSCLWLGGCRDLSALYRHLARENADVEHGFRYTSGGSNTSLEDLFKRVGARPQFRHSSCLPAGHSHPSPIMNANRELVNPLSERAK